MRRPPALDVAIAAALTALSWLALALGGNGPAGPAGDAVLMLAVCAPLAWRRVAPLACLLATLTAILVGAGVDHGANVPATVFVAALLAAYGAGAAPSRRRALLGGAAIVAQACLSPLVAGDSFLDTAPYLLVIVGAPWVGGRLVRRHADRAAHLADLVAQLERERTEHERLAVQAERTRIAAELNDAVAHTLAEVLMQAGAAGGLLGRDDDAARSALREVQRRGREAMLELRRMLLVMRAGVQRP